MEELPELLIKDLEVMLLVGIGLDILINIFLFLASHPACSIKIEFILVLFDQILLV